jgi:hypothetical protein
MLKLGCTLALLFVVTAASAQDFDYDELAGQVFWVQPAKEIYKRLEFYRQPNLTGASFFPQGKKTFRIIGVSRGWIKLNFISSFNISEEAFIPLGYLKRNIYSSKTYNEYAFNRATFFNEDPDDIKERANSPSVAPAIASTKSKSPASKFFRHKKKCCGLDKSDPPDYLHKTPSITEQQ